MECYFLKALSCSHNCDCDAAPLSQTSYRFVRLESIYDQLRSDPRRSIAAGLLNRIEHGGAYASSRVSSVHTLLGVGLDGHRRELLRTMPRRRGVCHCRM